MSATKLTPLYIEAAGGNAWCEHVGYIGRHGTVAPELFTGVGTLSRRHLDITQRDDGWEISLSPDARNPTSLDGDQMTPGKHYPLVGRHLVEIDKFRFIIGESTRREKKKKPSNKTQAMTEKQKTGALESLLAAVGSGPSALVVFDAGLRLLWSSRAADTMLGGARAGGGFFGAVEPKEVEPIRECLLGLKEKEPPVAFDFHLASNGETEEGPRKIDGHFSRRHSLYVGSLRDSTKELEPEPTKFSPGLWTGLLAECGRSEALQSGDLSASMQLLCTRAAKTLGCQRVRVWLKKKGEPEGQLFCHGSYVAATETASSPLEEVIQPGYCPDHFNPVSEVEGISAELAGTAVFGVLEGSGYVLHDTTSVLTVAVRLGGGSYGVFALERTGADNDEWSEQERNFARCLSDLCVLALAARLKKISTDAQREKKSVVKPIIKPVVKSVSKPVSTKTGRTGKAGRSKKKPGGGTA